MTVKFVRAWQWYKRGQIVTVPRSVGRLWVLMGRVEEVTESDTPPDQDAPVVVEGATLPGFTEAAVAVPQIRRRGRRRRDSDALSQFGQARYG